MVRAIFADKQAVLRQVRDYVEGLRRQFPEVAKVGLFGSYAKDTYGPASDVDLLIVLRNSPKRFLDRIPDFLPDNISACCDVFPYTEEEIARMTRQESPWIRRVLNEAIWL